MYVCMYVCIYIYVYSCLFIYIPLSATDGRLRQHFIRAEEVLWDYAPSGQTLYGTSVTQDYSIAQYRIV